MLTPGDEESLLLDIKEGIQYALYLGKQEGRFTEDEIHLDKIRLNKLQYIVNEDHDLGLTFGWFKYGPAPEDVTTDTGVALGPQPGDDIAHLEESRLPSKDHHSTEEFAYYFLRELDDEFDRIATAEETKVYLVSFYDEYAPKDEYAARFTDLYKASARLQQTLDAIGDGKDWHQNSTEFYYELDKEFLPVSEEVSKLESLEHTLEPLEEYRKLLTSIISEAGTEDNLSSSQQAFINNVIRKFYNTVWDFVGQEISLETIRGENVDELRPKVKTNVEKYRGGLWKDELNSLAERRESVGLDPEIEDIEKLESGGNGEDDEQSLDEEMVKRVSEMGAEVISD
ncbi:hypothetical protein [Halobacterium salinarum]|uniref:DUF8098 domain-containing protein n=1 Tax=Halobacterium salinarum (strain ATCC 33171 / DSM 3754 / JCM 8978 / NBRC 102687 / NCIMB 764 / 91-R6) TaxID=2597657 RepID=A0A4D6GTI1_HALS9|nr:hypothetical protein [Halobacterium salinarum]MDL0124044.1 hypothetical protein [Halobacterium salinarum]QCC45013.1 uncharacterized protein HBSAL_06795 [Halobacterium salinarum]TYO76125.1 hypothetical protein APQ99_01680 [Halobacterium salinarum DSM 3754]